MSADDTQQVKQVEPDEQVLFESEEVTLKELVTAVAEATGKPYEKEAKRVRSRIRANFDDLAENWPKVQEIGKENRDSNRYPAMPAELAEELFEKFTS